ncbi:hypothetical protein SK128_016861, partial [Halocaridina rubra]
MHLDQRFVEVLDVDGEGFPLASRNPGFPGQGNSWTNRGRIDPRNKNIENGEMTRERVVVLRKVVPPDVAQCHGVVMLPSSCYRRFPQGIYNCPQNISGFTFSENVLTEDYILQGNVQSLIKEHRLHSKFRIKEAMRLGELICQSTKGPESFARKVKNNQNGENGRFSWHNGNASDEPIWTDGTSSYEKEPENTGRKRPPDISVSIWEEFRYGSSIFNKISDVPVNHGMCEWFRPILERFLSKAVVDIIL